MRIGITGLFDSGKRTVFEALTHTVFDTEKKDEDRISIVKVPVKRLDDLGRIFEKKKESLR